MRTLSRRTGHLTVAVATLLVLMLGLSGPAHAETAKGNGSPTTASACSYGHHNYSDESGYVTASSLARRSGPYTSCDAYDYVSRNTMIYYHCWTYGSTVNGITTWTYGRVAGTSREGWFSDAYLSGGGAHGSIC
ncbi:hypothetical protein [Micromonospora sp. WMMD998]|uniref:hypothetical protein n=1 Tax=Micromonospora sp. WMMD998 TaxID=3016092 RepID=UPI00249BCB49|nr:hypothetical protein [Micromonospora sp. WMMD998]WFE37477.1 hypothetical protein O7619_03130 [Micromonospora sp. WMMD998]